MGVGSCSVALLYGKYSVCGAGYSGLTGGVKGRERERVGRGLESWVQWTDRWSEGAGSERE